jgi:hypothetical protein
MSSQIDNENIDSTYPVAGKDNDSQGFRDNFASIKSNFTYAKSEIEDLQSKAVLKAALTDGTLSNDFGGSNISNGTHTNFHGTSYSQTVGASGEIDVRNGSLQVFTVTSDSTLTFKYWPTSGKYGNVRTHFRSSGPIVTVGDSIVVGKRYTIDQVSNTNFINMGADPAATFVGSISGTTLTVSGVTSGTITKDMYIVGAGITAGTKIAQTSAENPGTLSGNGGTGTYVVDTIQTTGSVAMNGIVSGSVFVATTKGSGNGTVKPWISLSLITESTGTIISDSEFSLPLLLNPNQTDQVLEAWTYTGDSTRKIYLNYISNLDPSNVNYSILNTGTINVQESLESTSTITGAAIISGGLGVAKNLNVGGNVNIGGDLTVDGASVLTTSSVTITDIADIQNVEIADPRNGDSLKYNVSQNKWTNNVDLVEYAVTVPNVDVDIFNFNGVPITSAGLKFSVGKKYRFDLSNSVNEAAGPSFGTPLPLRFSTTPDTDVPGGSITPYTSNVTIESVNGNYIEILVTEDTPSPLYVYVPDMSPDPSGIGAAWPIQVGAGSILVVKDYSPLTSQDIIVNSSLQAVTITLPISPTLGTTITVVDNGFASTNNITINPGDAVTVNGELGVVKIAGNYGGITFVCDGTNWTSLRLSYNGSDDVINGAIIRLDTAVSYFATEGPETATMAAGSEGQVKTLVMKAYVGDMVVAVSNAGWKVGGGAGDITFDQIGDSCTLQYVDNKWYVIGNNGCQLDSMPAAIVSQPSSAASTGKAGDIAYDNAYIYICVADNTWKRAAIATWP